MKIIQSSKFERTVKKFTTLQKKTLDKHILKIIEDTSIGDEKKGDLKGVFIYKFKIGNTQYLLAYRCDADALELLMIGPHENYYRDLKNYIRS